MNDNLVSLTDLEDLRPVFCALFAASERDVELVIREQRGFFAWELVIGSNLGTPQEIALRVTGTSVGAVVSAMRDRLSAEAQARLSASEIPQ